MKQFLSVNESDAKHLLKQFLVTLSICTVLGSEAAQSGDLLSLSERRDYAPRDEPASEYADPSTGEIFFLIVDDAGFVLGWIGLDGSTYDTEGNLQARIDGAGKVLAADGTVVFDLHPTMAANDRKISLVWSSPLGLRFSRAETAAIASTGALGGELCAAIRYSVSRLIDPATGDLTLRACLNRKGWIVHTAYLANNANNKCLRLTVPDLTPSIRTC